MIFLFCKFRRCGHKVDNILSSHFETRQYTYCCSTWIRYTN